MGRALGSFSRLIPDGPGSSRGRTFLKDRSCHPLAFGLGHSTSHCRGGLNSTNAGSATPQGFWLSRRADDYRSGGRLARSRCESGRRDPGLHVVVLLVASVHRLLAELAKAVRLGPQDLLVSIAERAPWVELCQACRLDYVSQEPASVPVDCGPRRRLSWPAAVDRRGPRSRPERASDRRQLEVEADSRRSVEFGQGQEQGEESQFGNLGLATGRRDRCEVLDDPPGVAEDPLECLRSEAIGVEVRLTVVELVEGACVDPAADDPPLTIREEPQEFRARLPSVVEWIVELVTVVPPRASAVEVVRNSKRPCVVRFPAIRSMYVLIVPGHASRICWRVRAVPPAGG